MRRLALLIPMLAALGCNVSETAEEIDARALELVVDGEPVAFELRPNTRLFAADFGTYVVHDGQLRKTGGVPDDADCYLLGANGRSRLAVHSCRDDHRDLRGVLLHDERVYDLVGTAHGVEARVPVGKPGVCGFDGETADRNEAAAFPGVPIPTASDLETRQFALNPTRYIESLVVTDSGWSAGNAGGTQVADPIMTAHATAAVYDGQPFDDRVLPLLTGLVDLGPNNPWGDPRNGRVNSSPYLDDFNTWLASNVDQLPPFDHAALMTGYDMGQTIGLAVFEGSCIPEYAGALVYSVGSNAYATMTMAHEYGHLIGMDHDNSANCPPDTYVMTASYYADGPFPSDFSPCSIRDANAFLGSATGRCISPRSADAHPEPRCGDGKVEGDEQCDCGPDGCEGRDPCCNGATCRLESGASCSAFDACCDATNCAPHPPDANVECRSKRGSCDVAETCDGGARCPVDQVIETGTECTDSSGWSGACFVGECVTRGATCEELAAYYVFDDPPYDEMCSVDVGCGPMECLGEGQCLVTEDPTPDGIPCGDGFVCFEGDCVTPDALPGADGCANPDQDVDGDGTGDCYDACPNDPDATTEPCGEPVDPNNATENNATTTNGGQTIDPDDDGMDSMTDDDTIIIVDDEDERGCSSVGGDASGWAWLLMLVFARRRRRKD